MERIKDNILKRLDWWTIIIFALLATMGWLAICGSTHSYIETGSLISIKKNVKAFKNKQFLLLLF